MKKLTKKINHDNMWMKVTDGKGWAKLFIGRTGTKATCNCASMQDTARKLFSEYKKLYSSGSTNGECIEKLYTAFNKEI